MMPFEERVVMLGAAGSTLLGIAHVPHEGNGGGVLIVPGAPQYRVGPHRLFVDLARHLAGHGYTVLRMDRRGYGDNDAPPASFEESGPEVAAGVEVLAGLGVVGKPVHVLGLCDGASAALLHATGLTDVGGIILLNPWARTESGEARALLGSYYLPRMLRWRRWVAAVTSVARFRGALTGLANALVDRVRAGRTDDGTQPAFIDLMLRNWITFPGQSLVVLSGRDRTAAVFEDMIDRTVSWPVLARSTDVSVVHQKEADHTFTSRHQKMLLAETILDWLDQGS
jgi:exosortase A-associated hydrolase 1